MQPSSSSPSQPQPAAPRPPAGQGQPSHPAVNYTAPAFSPDGKQSTTPEQDEYSFIMEPGAPSKKLLGSVAPNSLPARLLFGLGSVLLIVTVIVFAKSILSGGSNKLALLAVAQQQQKLVQIATNATAERTATEATMNSANTVSITVLSANQQLNTYFVKNNFKFKPLQLNAKLGRVVTKELTTAAANDNYDQTYQNVMQSSLLTYGSLLKQAYRETPGHKGRTLLKDDYTTQQLLLGQLTEPAS